MGLREIARRLNVSRNVVREIVGQRGEMPARVRGDKIHIDEELLRRLFEECEGWRQRIHEKLLEEEGVEVSYPTLTRILRELGLGRSEKVRCQQVPDKPGAEMQHDTTPYTLVIGGKPQKVIASLIYLRYSKRRYLKLYGVFNRFTMKCFFHEALMHWGHAAGICIIDNTNLARLHGTGKDAVMVPEMAAFGDRYGFKFVCHAKGHPNRKAGEERSFWTVETNFLPGRTFASLEDLNAQAFQWATVRMYHRPVAKTDLIPAKAFEHERAYLVGVPAHLPAPYRVHKRGTDQYGYVAFDGNYYWVPGTRRDEIQVLEYSDRLQLYRARELLSEYKLPAAGVKNHKLSPEGFPKPCYEPKNRKHPTVEEEKRLRAMAEVMGAYLDFALKPQGSQRHRFVRELFRLAQQMTPALFLKTVERAFKYRIASIETLRRIAGMYMNDGLELLPSAEVDESYEERETYQEGRLSDTPDLSAYDDMLEDHDG
jgi:transposase